MNDRLFADLRLPRPDINLEVGSGTHAVQTAEVMKRFEPALDEHKPRCVLVVGDVNSTLACTLVAVKKGVPVVHVEAGLRSYDRAHARRDQPRAHRPDGRPALHHRAQRAADNLLREGVAAERVCFAGNVMIDSLRLARRRARAADTLRAHGLRPGAAARGAAGYGVVTLHRPSNVDDPTRSPRCWRAARGRRSPAAGLRAAPAHARQHRALRPGDLLDARAWICCRRRATWRCSA
jgi:UDP-N-acetylglucosamine 2-epimerase (non-hydrolysing)